MFDGELVADKPWRKDNSAPIFLVFDALVVNQVNMIALNFSDRLLDAHKYIEKRFLPARAMPSKEGKLPSVDLYMKEMFNVWDAV